MKLNLIVANNLPYASCILQGEDFNDWLAVHVVDFFNRINLIYGTVCEQVSFNFSFVLLYADNFACFNRISP